MPLESATYITDLVVTNPANADGLNQADDHMRMIKSAVKATFPNFTSAPLTSTQANIDSAVIAANTMNARSASVPAGAIMDFAGPSVPTGWLECNQAAVSRTTYAALFAAIGTTWGAGDGSTTFNLPPDRYRRGRTAAGAAVGTFQADQNKSHTHPVVGSTAAADRSLDHLHTGSGTTGNDSPDHTHNYTTPTNPGSTTGGGGFGIPGVATTGTTAGANQRHQHPFSFTSNGMDRSIDHLHAISFTSGGGSADGAEARPLTAVFVTCIKT